MEEDIEISVEQVREVCGYMRAGATFDIALAAAGIREDPHVLWARMKSADSGFFYEFFHDVRKAAAHFEILQLQRIIGEGSAAGAKWILERSMSKKWGRVSLPAKSPQELDPPPDDTECIDLFDIDVASLELDYNPEDSKE